MDRCRNITSYDPKKALLTNKDFGHKSEIMKSLIVYIEFATFSKFGTCVLCDPTPELAENLFLGVVLDEESEFDIRFCVKCRYNC
jgi:hypothetical protein